MFSVFCLFLLHLANNETNFSNFLNVLGLLIKAKEYFKGACHHFLVSAAEVPEIVQLVFNMEKVTIVKLEEVEMAFQCLSWSN